MYFQIYNALYKLITNADDLLCAHTHTQYGLVFVPSLKVFI